MRLTTTLLVLLVTALDIEFGRPGAALHIASLTAGALLAASIIIDRFVLHEDAGNGSAAHPTAQSRPAAPPAEGQLSDNPGRPL